MHVALLANLKKNAPTWPGISPDYWDDLHPEQTIEALAAALAWERKIPPDKDEVETSPQK